MTIPLYMDEHVARAVTLGLRRRGLDVLTVQEDNRTGASDPEVMDRAAKLHRVLFSQDDDLLVEAHRRQSAGVSFGGLVYGHQMRVTIGQIVEDLDFLARAAEPGELMNSVIFLPL